MIDSILDYTFYCKDIILGTVRNYLQPYVPAKYNISKITDHLYISDLSSTYFIDNLKKEGITHIITTIIGVYPRYTNDFEYLYLPLRDTSSENISKYFDVVYDFIEKAVEQNGKVLVHCAYGISRSSSILISYIMRKEGITYEMAYKKVKDIRGIINPNDGFKRQLELIEMKK